MPLSRLPKRDVQSRLIKRKAHKKTSDNLRHLQLWAAIKTTRDELDKWHRQIEQVEALFNLHIVPLEQQLTLAVCDVTEQLIALFSNEELSQADKSLIGLWINDNLSSLKNHPFADATRTSGVVAQWLSLLKRNGPIENQLARLAQKHNFSEHHDEPTFKGHGHEAEFEEVEDDDDEVLFDFGMHSKHDSKQPEKDENTGYNPKHTNKEQSGTRQENNQHKPSDRQTSTAINNEKVAGLEDKLSVERLFRQLAKVLHPDREQDEQAKAAKNALMSECLEARNNKDINALLTLYCEHVGDLPDELDENSHSELVNALEEQLKALQQELRLKRFGDPLQAMIVERYSAANKADCERRIQKHALSLQAEVSNFKSIEVQLESHDGIHGALEQRRAIELDRLAIDELTGY